MIESPQPNFDSARFGKMYAHAAAKSVIIDYSNHRGERHERTILPLQIQWGSNPWHPEPQWLLHADDLDKGEERTFAVKDIHSWRPSRPLDAATGGG